MFLLSAEKNQLRVLQREGVTSGSVNVYRVRFTFDETWEGLARTAVFRTGDTSASVLLDSAGECVIPWEVLTESGVHRTLYAGVYGSLGGEVVLPTVWAGLGIVLEGTEPGERGQPPTPDLYDQVLTMANEARQIAQSVRDDANAGKFKGEKGDSGPTGPKGEQGERGETGPQGEKGNVLYAVFDVDPGTGSLRMDAPEDYGGPQFRLHQSNLEVMI